MKKASAVFAVSLILLLSGCRGEAEPPETENTFTIRTETAEETESEPEPEPESETESEPEPESEAKRESESEPEAETEPPEEQTGILASPEDIGLVSPGGDGKNYTFSYGGETFQAVYTPDNWKVIDSFRITNEADITMICQALLSEHPIHGADGSSYRSADDMAYEWIQHNLAYEVLPEDNPWREHAKDVDLNPADQGKTIDEIYEDRTGKKMDSDLISTFLESMSSPAA